MRVSGRSVLALVDLVVKIDRASCSIQARAIEVRLEGELICAGLEHAPAGDMSTGVSAL